MRKQRSAPIEASGFFVMRAPLLPLQVNGAGDAIAALFFGHLLERGSAAEAMALAVSSMFGVLSRTLEVGAREMLLVEAQEELLRPSLTFEAERL